MTTINPIAAALRATPAAAWRETAKGDLHETELPESESPAADLEDEDAPKRVHIPRAAQASQKNAALVKIIGSRMKAARELCNMSQLDAAIRLGYVNSSKLNKIEHATDTISVPFWIIRDAALLYDVSTEYLYGLSDDWEAGCQRGITNFLQQEWDQQRARDLKALAVLNRRILAALEAFPNLADAAENTLGAVEAFTLHNKDFDDRPCGARLMAAARRLREVTAAATATQKRLHLELPEELRSEEAHDD